MKSKKSLYLFLLLLFGCDKKPTAPGVEPIDESGPIFLDSVVDEGQRSYRIETKTATYYFQTDAGGLSSMVDKDGNDWISFNSTPGPKGLYRGIPNLVNNEGLFHPGFRKCRSRIVSQNDSVVVFSSEDLEGGFRCDWTIRTSSATVSVTKAAGNFWFLYEGTPGGSFEMAQDYWINSNGMRRNCDITISGDLSGEEWICFGQPGLKRVLFLAHHENDAAPDYYYPLGGSMTVFGFGRYGSQMYLSQTPQHFTFGFLEDTLYSRIAPKIPRIMEHAEAQ